MKEPTFNREDETMLTLTHHRPDAWKYEPATIAGKRVIITGGTTGIGRSTALLLASLGAKVLIFGRHERELNDAIETMRDCEDRVVGLTADVTREADVDRVFQTIDQQFGGLDILINNAGIGAGSIDDASPDAYRQVIETNLIGYLACAQRALSRLREQHAGRIINIGSLSAKGQGPDSDIYVATKTAIRGFSESLARKVQNEDIYVTLIEPGSTGADINPESPEEERKLESQGEMLVSECIAEAVLWCMTQPRYCYVPLLQVQPLHEKVR
ncbi:SDR family oxidoreductase [Phycisphaerales bacterium AB-hyl4]|uniref:SDR family oxidoreductase n=1 Tax=Natronomicrosphaera hydrolytica TaxID=3242702 RepID=A0ABV4U933_9BACT